VQYTRVHTDRSQKRQPVEVMSLRSLLCALGTSPVCLISAFDPLEYDHDRTQCDGWNKNATKSIRERNG